MIKKKCLWATKHKLEEHYHDTEWGVPIYDDNMLFEFLILEGAQAGLSWLTILVKRENYRKAFDQFDANKIVKYDQKKSIEVFVEDAETLGKEHTSVLKLKVGDKAPNFELPNASNKTVALYDVLKENKVILIFYRGAWCPYCNLQLKQFQAVLPEFKAANIEIMAISPQIPDASLSMKEKEELQFEVLSDIGNEATRKFVTVFKNTDEMRTLGIEFDDYYADDSKEIPVPATFLIEQDGIISYAQSKGGDYRTRMEISEIFETLK